MLKHIPEMVNEKNNATLNVVPTVEEVKQVVISLKGSHTCGPDGFSGLFYQHCWDIVKVDVHNMIKIFCEGNSLSKSITHTNLVLIPKKEIVESFLDPRPISLSNFINKVIS